VISSRTVGARGLKRTQTLLASGCVCSPTWSGEYSHRKVVTAFLSSALLAWFTTVGYILLEPRNKSKRTNPIDELWKKHICLPVQRWVGPHADVWSECFYRVTFSLSDQQLVTGIAILTAGFKMLAQGTITAYHFSIVRDLAFFSSNAHLLSLLVLWTSFGSIRKHHKRTGARRRFPVTFVTMWRFSCMAVFFGLLMAATWMSAHRDWDEWADCPARCIPKGIQNVGGVPIAWAIATTYFMVTQYSSCAMQLGEKIMGRATGLRKRTRDVDKGLRARLKSRPILLKAYKVLRLVLVSWRFYNWSEFFELLEMMVWFLANCYWVAGNRAAAKWVFDTSADGRNERAKEDEWGFGQIVPLFLLSELEDRVHCSIC
jgi:hypothetical protein